MFKFSKSLSLFLSGIFSRRIQVIKYPNRFLHSIRALLSLYILYIAIAKNTNSNRIIKSVLFIFFYFTKLKLHHIKHKKLLLQIYQNQDWLILQDYNVFRTTKEESLKKWRKLHFLSNLYWHCTC